MSKEKLKYVPFNLFWCASTFIVSFFILTQILNFGTLESSMVALYIYLTDVRNQTDVDDLSERIRELEDYFKIVKS
jgi:hypothetical protein